MKQGQPVQIDEVLSLYEAMCSSPFKTVLTILTGTDRISPCPFCDQPESSMSALDYVGMCYGCGKITLDRLYDLVFLPLSIGKKAK